MDGIRVGRWQWPLVEGLGTRRGDKIIKTSKGWYQDIEVLPLWQPKNLFDFAVLLLLPQGIQYLIEQQLLSSDLQEIAKFLHKGEGLNKTAIGDFLGGRWATHPRWGGPLEALSCLAPLSHPLDEPWETTDRCWDWPWSHTVVGWMGRTPWRMSFRVWLRLAVWATCPSICTGVSLPRQDWCPCILAPCWVEGMGKLGGSQVHVVTPQGIQTEQGQSSLLIFSLCPLPGTPQTFRSSKLLWHVTSLPTSTWCRH